MVHSISVQEFLEHAKHNCVIDVRAPLEFQRGHIPGAYNIPLFSDAERAVVGTVYKQQGKQEAIRVGLEFVGPQLNDYIEKAKSIASTKTLLVYCARGGMRSKSFCMLLATCGYRVYQLNGGYKAFKKYLRDAVTSPDQPFKFVLLGGKTGCGKTNILHALQQQGEQVLNLEQLAHHKGSVFGALGEQPQPPQETFMINCFCTLAQCDRTKIIWVEKESYKIGDLTIPHEIWHQLQQAPVVYLEISYEQRIKNILNDYGYHDRELIKHSIQRLTTKIGGARVKNLCAAIEAKNITSVLHELLEYYDQCYTFSLQKNNNQTITHLNFDAETPAEIAEKLRSGFSIYPPCFSEATSDTRIERA